MIQSSSMNFDFKKVFSELKKSPIVQHPRVVGIDFGSSSLKVVEVESRDGVITLTTYGELQLGPYGESSLGNSVKLTPEKRVEAIVDVLRESSVTAKDAVYAMQLGGSFVTIISLPAKENEDIAPRVNVEARKYIPVPIADVALEWSEIPQRDDASVASREVLLVAIQNESLTEMKSLLDSISMTSKPSEIEMFSTLRAVTREKDSSVAIIDIGASMSKLYIAQDGFLQRIHKVPKGGAYATERLAQELNVSFEAAENIKRNYPEQSEYAPVIKKIMSDTFERTFQEFQRAINQYELRTGSPVSRVTLTGGSALYAEFQSNASMVFSRDVETTNPFAKVAYPAFMEDTLKKIAPVFTVALGAALRTFEE